jgi:hypothetical protein
MTKLVNIILTAEKMKAFPLNETRVCPLSLFFFHIVLGFSVTAIRQEREGNKTPPEDS